MANLELGQGWLEALGAENVRVRPAPIAIFIRLSRSTFARLQRTIPNSRREGPDLQ
jgi:hypothetical protein